MSTSICQDCGRDLDPIPLGYGVAEYFYMVRDEVWHQAGMTTEWGSFLCVGCLETRLGRELDGNDFKPNLVTNQPQRQDTPRLADRKRRQTWKGSQIPLPIPMFSDREDLPPSVLALGLPTPQPETAGPNRETRRRLAKARGRQPRQ